MTTDFSPLLALARLSPYQWSAGLVMRGMAMLKMADYLAVGPRTAEELARAMGAFAPSMARFLRGCAVHGLVEADADGRYTLTDVGQLLRSDVPSLRDFVIAVNGPGMTRAWELLPQVVMNGQSASTKALGMEHWEYYAEHPEEGKHYARTFDLLGGEASAALGASYGFDRFERIVDIGGCPGTLLAHALEAAPRAVGVLQELAWGIPHARTLLTERGVLDRVELIEGDALDSVPPDGDLYIVKNVLSDLDDERASRLLANCAKAAAAGGCVFLIDWALGDQPSFVDANDLEFMVLSGGRARTREEYEALLLEAGFQQPTDVALPGYEMAPFVLLEAVRP